MIRLNTSRNSRTEGLVRKSEFPRLEITPVDRNVLEKIVADHERHADLAKIRHIQHVFGAERGERHHHHVELTVIHRLQVSEITGPLNPTVARRIYS